MSKLISILLSTLTSEEERYFVTKLFDDYYQMLFQQAIRIVHNRHDAEDICQDFFEYIIHHIEKFKRIDEDGLAYYLMLCVKRRSIDLLRKRSAESEHVVGSINHDQYAFSYKDERESEDIALHRVELDEIINYLPLLPNQLKKVGFV